MTQPPLGKKKPAEVLRAFRAYKKIAAGLRARAIILDIRLNQSNQFAFPFLIHEIHRIDGATFVMSLTRMDSAQRERFLAQHLFVRLETHRLWFSRVLKMALSYEVVRMRDSHWLRQRIRETAADHRIIVYIEASRHRSPAAASI